MQNYRMDLLGDTLYQVSTSLNQRGIFPLIGGGYGLLLRHRYLQKTGAHTLRRILPTRSTEDLDVFLTAELIADAEKVKALRDVHHTLGFEAVDAAGTISFKNPFSRKAPSAT